MALDEQDEEATELQRLEAEFKQQLAQFKSETLTRQQVIQERRTKIDRLEEVKKLNAAKAQAKSRTAYDFDSQRVNDESAVDFQVPNTKGSPFIPFIIQVPHLFPSFHQMQVKPLVPKVCIPHPKFK